VVLDVDEDAMLFGGFEELEMVGECLDRGLRDQDVDFAFYGV
jgi:hypothetical protein